MFNNSTKSYILVAILVTILFSFSSCQKESNSVSNDISDNSISQISKDMTIVTGAKPNLSSFKDQIKVKNTINDSKNSNKIQDGKDDDGEDNDGEDHDGENHDGNNNKWEKIGFNINIGSGLNSLSLDRTQTKAIKGYLESYEDCYESAKKSISKQIEALKKSNDSKSESIKKSLKKGTITKAQATLQLADLTESTNNSIASLQSIVVGCDCLDNLFTNIYNSLNPIQKGQFKSWAATLNAPCPLSILARPVDLPQ